VARAVTDAVSRAALTTVAAYGSFLLAERFHAAGIVASLVAGLMTSRARLAGQPGSPERGAVVACWDYASFALNSLVFLLVGFQAIQVGDMLRLWRPILVAYFVVTAGRALVVAVVGWVLRRTRERLPGSWWSVLTWSGLRGALSMVLAIDLPESLPERQWLLTVTCGVVILSIFVQGSTMTALLRRTGLIGVVQTLTPEAAGAHPLPRSPAMEITSLNVKPVEHVVHHAGWLTALRGILAVAFGVIALRSPGVAATVLVIVFAVYAFADGFLDIVLAARLGRAGQRWGWHLFEGIAGIALGVIALAFPHLTLLVLVLFVALRAIILGVVEVAAAFSWEGADSRWLLGLAGMLSVILGILLLAGPVAGAVALVWAIGVYAIIFGVALFALGLRMISAERHERHEQRAMHGPPAATAAS
jgi:uncharacterized membrane protein HdeD (DUF308 family)